MRSTFFGTTVEAYTCPRCRVRWWQSSPAPRGYWRMCLECAHGEQWCATRRRFTAADRAMAKIAAAVVFVAAILLATLWRTQ